MEHINPEKALQDVQNASETNTLPESRHGKPRGAAMIRFWQRMAAIYGHKWTSSFGDSPFNDQGVLTIAGDTWQRGLTGIPEPAIAAGLQAALTSADGWPPTLPAFRALCYGIPPFSIVRREAYGAHRSGFTTHALSRLDMYRWKHTDQDKADRLLREAYEETTQFVVSGGVLPKPSLALSSELGATEAKARTPEDAAKSARIAREAIETLEAKFCTDETGRGEVA